MNIERENVVHTFGEHTFAIKTYATAREAATIQQAYFKGTKVEVIGQEPKISEFNPNVQYEVQLEMIRQMVVWMDDTTEAIVERCENLPNEVFGELSATLDAIVSKKKS